MLRLALFVALLLALSTGEQKSRKPINLNAEPELDPKVPADPSKLVKMGLGQSPRYSDPYPTFQGRQLDKVRTGTHSHASGHWMFVNGGLRPMPDPELFPRYFETSLMPVYLAAGDMLYVPWGWSYWALSQDSIMLNFYSKSKPHKFPGSSEGTLPSQISGGAFRHTDKEFWLHSDDATIHEHIKDLFDDREDFGFAKLPPQEQDEPTNIRCCAPQQQLLPEACVAPLSNLHLWIYNTPKKAQRPWHGHGLHSYDEVMERKAESPLNTCLVWSSVPQDHWFRTDVWIRKMKPTDYKVGFWFTSGRVDTGLHYNLYHNTILNLRGNSTILLWAPEDADKLYYSNQDWIAEERHKWEVYKQKAEAAAKEAEEKKKAPQEKVL